MNDGQLRDDNSLDQEADKHTILHEYSQNVALSEENVPFLGSHEEHLPLSKINENSPLVAKYGKPFFDVVLTFNRHVSEYNRLIDQQLQQNKAETLLTPLLSETYRTGLLEVDQGVRQQLISERLMQLKDMLEADYFLLQDYCRFLAGQQVMVVVEGERENPLLTTISEVFANHASVKKTIDEINSRLENQRVDLQKEIAELPDESNLAEQIEILNRDISNHRQDATRLQQDIQAYQAQIEMSPDESSFYELRLNTCQETLETEQKYLETNQLKLSKLGRQMEQLVGLKIRRKKLIRERFATYNRLKAFWDSKAMIGNDLSRTRNPGPITETEQRVERILEEMREDILAIQTMSSLPWQEYGADRQEDELWFFFALTS
ncbi:hypothetical protein [Endozoicomonas sp.]|uniref:hypothetical protein n=1 Tax=Endozoicomonas sp. TaxID=1892382 RepID=UPI003AF774E4